MKTLVKTLLLTVMSLVFMVGAITTFNYVTGVKNNIVSQYEDEENWSFVLGIETADKKYEYSVFNPTAEVLNVSLDERFDTLMNNYNY